MHLVSLVRQSVHCDGASIDFEPGEPIITEYSRKYSIPEFGRMAAEAGCKLRRVWTDSRGWFAVLLLEPTSG